MHRGAYNEDVALQPRPAREFASKLFIPKKHDTDLFQIIQSVKMALFKNASEFQDVSVREFQFDEN